MVEGIDPLAEKRVSTLAEIVRQGGYLNAQLFEGDLPEALPEALIGHLLARNLRVGVGDELTLLGQGRDGSIAATVVRVKGITDSGLDEFDRNVIQIPLAHFQEAFTMGDAVHEIVVIGHRLADTAAIKKTLLPALKEIDARPGACRP